MQLLLYTVLNITLLTQRMHAHRMQCKLNSPSSQSYIARGNACSCHVVLDNGLCCNQPKQNCMCRYYITDGAKFGADYLLYPGDPLLFHAQFTVRILEHDTPIKPALLAGSARGSHAARKHLLLASVNMLTYGAALHCPVFACSSSRLPWYRCISLSCSCRNLCLCCNVSVFCRWTVQQLHS